MDPELIRDKIFENVPHEGMLDVVDAQGFRTTLMTDKIVRFYATRLRDGEEYTEAVGSTTIVMQDGSKNISAEGVEKFASRLSVVL